MSPAHPPLLAQGARRLLPDCRLHIRLPAHLQQRAGPLLLPSLRLPWHPHSSGMLRSPAMGTESKCSTWRAGCSFNFLQIVQLLNAVYCIAELLEFAAFIHLRFKWVRRGGGERARAAALRQRLRV